MFAEPSKDTPCMVLAVSRVVAVVAFPVISPTKEVAAKILLETNLPSLLFQVIVGLLEDPPNSIPAPLVADKVVAFLPTLIVRSSTSNVAVLRVVVVPFTVKLPVTVKAPPIVTLSGSPIVTAAVSLPDPDTSISFVVPAIVAT